MSAPIQFKRDIVAPATPEELANPVGVNGLFDVSVTNRNSAAVKIRFSRRDGVLENEDYIYYDQTVKANETLGLYSKEVFAAGEIITVQSDTTGVNFHMIGKEF